MPATQAPPRTTIVTSADPGWDDARQTWSLTVDQHPVAVAQPRSASRGRPRRSAERTTRPARSELRRSRDRRARPPPFRGRGPRRSAS